MNAVSFDFLNELFLRKSRDLNLYVVLKVYEMPLNKARWLSWLERRPVTAEVVGSSPIRVACRKHLVLIA